MSFWCQKQPYQYFFLLAFTDVSMMSSGIFFLFLKENVLHFYSYNIE